MIKLTKVCEPQILKENKETWTSEILGYIKSDKDIPDNLKNKYNCYEVKVALKKESHGKCMYCESYIGHISYGHIEHYRPKAKNKYPDLTFEWSNLGWSCPICNTNKGDEFDESCPFVNPYFDDPSEFFIAAGQFIYHNHGNSRANLTEIKLDLNRIELVEIRYERIKNINLLIVLYEKETNLTKKEIIKQEIENEISPEKPYSLCARSIVKAFLGI